MQMLKNEDAAKISSQISATGTKHAQNDAKDVDTKHQQRIDPNTALKNFLDRVPISSISVVDHSSGLELKARDNVIDALQLLFDNDLLCAPITDLADSGGGEGGGSDVPGPAVEFADRYIGFVDFPGMVLWCLEAMENQDDHERKRDADIDSKSTFFSVLIKENPHLAQAKVADLAKSFIWQPFFPVHLEVDTLLHVLLLLSKHPMHVLPVVRRSDSKLTSFITQNAVIHLLLQSSGLEWFDSIADKSLSEFCFESGSSACLVYADQNIAEVLEILCQNKATAVAVVEQERGQLVGAVGRRDLHLLFQDEGLFSERRTKTVREFLHVGWHEGELEIQEAGTLRLKDNSLLTMDSPVTHKKTDTLKQAMKRMVDARSEFSFLVDGSGRVCSTLTSRDMIVEFAPPGVDSTIYGGSFFDSVLDQVGARVRNGTLIHE